MGSRPNFHDRVDMNPIYDGLAREGIVLTEAERQRLAQSMETHTRGYEGSDLLGDNLGLGIQKLAYFFIYMIQNIGGNTGNFSMSNFGQWVSDRFGQSVSGTEHAMIQQAAMAVHGDMMSAGGNLARAATLVTGQRIAGSGVELADRDWSMFRQIERGARELTPEQIARGTSLNGAGERFNVAEATGPSAPGPTPAVPATSTLTVPPSRV